MTLLIEPFFMTWKRRISPNLSSLIKTVILTEQMEALKSSIVYQTASIAEQIVKGSISVSAHPILTNMVAEAKI